MDAATGAHGNCVGFALALAALSTSLLAAPELAAAAEPAWWTQQKRACGLPPGMAYNDWNGVCNSGSAPAAPSVPMGNTPAQMMNKMGQDMIMQGVQELFNPTPKTPEQLEAERQAEIARQAAEAARQKKIQDYLAAEAQKKREREDALDAEAKQSLALLPQAPDAGASLSDDELLHPKPKSQSYDLGLNDALQCISRNAGPRCSGVPSDQVQACVSEYNAGYAIGQAKVKLALSEADMAGKTDGAKGAPSNGAADPRATEGCRTEWIRTYNRGYFEGKHATAP